jgi:hypothetical protein
MSAFRISNLIEVCTVSSKVRHLDIRTDGYDLPYICSLCSNSGNKSRVSDVLAINTSLE